jgi:transcriptional regulator with XRE-family HTH domain
MKKNSHYKQAVILRKKGWSYNVIINRLGVSKSTLSNWLSDVPFVPNAATLKRIKNGPAKSAERRRKQKKDNIRTLHKAASEELGMISQRDLWMMGIGLYIGEGSKKFEEVRIVNSNSQVIRLMVIWLTQVCKVPKRNLQLRLYAYPDTDIKKAIKFWLHITGLPSESFAKVQIDERKNKKAKKWKQLPNGTLHIIVRSWGNKSLGVTLHRRISGWIETFYNNAGVV